MTRKFEEGEGDDAYMNCVIKHAPACIEAINIYKGYIEQTCTRYGIDFETTQEWGVLNDALIGLE